MLEIAISLLKKAIVFAVAFYFVALAFLYFLQDSLVFPAPDTSCVDLIPGAIFETMTTSDGAELRHVRLAATPKRPKLIYFHGNGDAALFSQQLGRHFNEAGFDVLLAEYRGYGGSSGRPAAKKLLSDAVETYDRFVGENDDTVFVFTVELECNSSVP